MNDKKEKSEVSKRKLMTKMVKKAELDVDVPDLVFKGGLSNKEILERIRPACVMVFLELEKEMNNDG